MELPDLEYWKISRNRFEAMVSKTVVADCGILVSCFGGKRRVRRPNT
jgi:hypothetical protein